MRAFYRPGRSLGGPAVLALTLSLVAAVPTAGPAAASAPVAQVVDVPVPTRERAADVAVVATSTGGTLLSQERADGYGADSIWLPVDGDERGPVSAGQGRPLIDDRVVSGLTGETTVGFSDLTTGTFTELSLPDDADVWSAGPTGILFSTYREGSDAIDGSLDLSVLGWDDVVRPVTDLSEVDGLDRVSTPLTNDGHVIVSSWDRADNRRLHYLLDTTTSSASPIDIDNHLRATTVVSDGSLVAWWERDDAGTYDDSDDTYLIARTTVQDGVAGPVERSQTLPSDSPYRKLVIADGVVLLTGSYSFDHSRPETAPVTPLQRLLPDGSIETVGLTRPVHAAPGGGLVTSDGTAVITFAGSVVDLAVESRVVRQPVHPSLPASGVTVDGPRLLVGSADVRWWDEVALTSPDRLPSGTVVDRPARRLSFHRGAGVYQIDSDLAFTAALPGVRPPGGTSGEPVVFGPVSGDHVLLIPGSSSSVLTRLGDERTRSYVAIQAALSDGVLWEPFHEVVARSDDPHHEPVPELVVGRDLETGSTTIVSAGQGCALTGTSGFHPIQAAGRWLLVQCADYSHRLLDTLGVLPPEPFARGPESFRLGNGALLRSTITGTETILEWRAADDPGGTWASLGPVGLVPSNQHGERTWKSVSVSTWGSTVSAAWLTPDDQVRHAVLPVAATDRPTLSGPAVAPAPVEAVAASLSDDGAVDVTWEHPGTDVVGFRVAAVDGLWRFGTVFVDPALRSARLERLSLDRTVRIEVEAVGAAGASVPGGLSVTPRLVRPGIPTGLDFVPGVFQHSTTTVLWAQSTTRPSPSHFDVYVNGVLVASPTYTETRADDRTQEDHRFDLATPDPGQYSVRVVARLDAWAESSATITGSLPGTDLVAPTMGSTSVPAVATTSRARYTFVASDDRYIDGYQVRVRQAGRAKTLGAWTQPSKWAALPSSARGVDVILAEGETRCVQARARDVEGNWSAWSPQRCVVRAVDDRHLPVVGAHTRLQRPASLMGTLTRLDSKGSQVRLTGNRTDAIWIVVARCPTCGAVELVDDGTVFARVDLRSPTTAYAQVVKVPLGRATRSGTITVRSATSKPAHVDGLFLRSY